MYLRFLFSFKESISRKKFICIVFPLLVVFRFIVQIIFDLLVKYAAKDHPFMLALSNQENTMVFDNNWLIVEYTFFLIIWLGLFIGLLYATSCVILGRLRSQGWPLWMTIPMLVADILILQYIWIPLCLFKEKNNL